VLSCLKKCQKEKENKLQIRKRLSEIKEVDESGEQ